MREIRRLSRSFSTDDNQPTFWDKFESGAWEPETLALLDELLTPQSTFIDVGAWVGPTSLWAAFSARRVISLEADPVALDQLRRNLTANPALSRCIEVVPRALSPQPGTVTMGAARKRGDSMSSVLLADRDGSWRTDTITAQQLAEMLGPQDDVVLKMDIEGGEYALLPTMMPVMQKVRAALISFHHELARTALGWTQEHIAQVESEIFAQFGSFQKRQIGTRRTGSSTTEWLFE